MSHLNNLGKKKRAVVLLVGGAGFVGQSLARKLCVLNCEVWVYDIATSPSPESAAADTADDNVLRYVRMRRGDVTDGAALLGVVRESSAQVVVHLASWGMSGAAMLDARTLLVNETGVRVLLSVCRECGVRGLVYTSSYNVVFGGQEIVAGDESLAYFPLELHTDQYSRSKAVAEALVLRANCAELRTIAVRPAAIYGEGEARHFPRIRRLMDGGLFLFKVGDATVDWVHVDNLTLAFLAAIDKLLLDTDTDTGTADTCTHIAPPFGRAYFVSDGSPVHSWDFLRPLAESCGCAFPSTQLPVWLMLWAALLCEKSHIAIKTVLGVSVEPYCTRAEVLKVGVTHHFRIDRARRELGYAPCLDSSEGMRRVAAYHGARINNAHYFRPAPLLAWAAILAGMAATYVIGYQLLGEGPVSVYLLRPLERLNLAVFGSHAAVRAVFWGAVGIHGFEAGVALYAMRGRGYTHTWLPWTLQTFALGYPSLSLLLARNAFMDKRKQQQ